MEKQLFIFDLDGTILDTLDDLTDSTNFALEKNGFAKRTKEEIRTYVGNGIGKLIARAVPGGTEEGITAQVLRDFSEFYQLHCSDKTKPYKGMIETIQDLRKEGFLTAVVSNKADFAVQELCEKYFPKMFDCIVGERKGIRRKPAPDSVIEVMMKLKMKKENCIYIGDSEVDIQTAKNAQIPVLSVTWGFRPEAFLVENGAERIIREPKEIMVNFPKKNEKPTHRGSSQN